MQVRFFGLFALLVAASSFAQAATGTDYLEFLRNINQGASSIGIIDEESLKRPSDEGLPGEEIVYIRPIKKVERSADGAVTHWSKDWRREQASPNRKALIVTYRSTSIPRDYAFGAGLSIGDQATCGEPGYQAHRGTIRSIYANPLRSIFQLETEGRLLTFSRCWPAQVRRSQMLEESSIRLFKTDRSCSGPSGCRPCEACSGGACMPTSWCCDDNDCHAGETCRNAPRGTCESRW